MSYRVEKIEDGREIVIDGWQDGIADNPYSGISDMRNIDPTTVRGEASVAMKTETMQSQGAITNVAFTCDHTTETFTYNGLVPLEVNTAIIFTGADLPNGLTADTTAYYIKTIPTPTTFTVSEVSAGGALKTVSDNGTGAMTFSTIQMGTPIFNTDYVNTFLSTLKRYYFLLDSNGRAWVYNSVSLGNSGKWIYMKNQTTEASLTSGNGFKAYKGYLFIFTPVSINFIRILDPTAVASVPNLAYLTTYGSWTIGWKTTISVGDNTTSHYAIIGQDDILYFCNGNSVGSLSAIPSSLTSTYFPSFNVAETHTVADGVTTSGSKSITTVTNFFSSTDIGAVIVGTGIPTGTIIASVTDAKTATLSENATASASGLTFTITSAYSFNASALDLPSYEVSICLEELGQNLLIGGIDKYIYPWDRISASYNFPIYSPEIYISRMVTVGNITYIFSGHRGNIYITNGSNLSHFKKIPDHLSNTISPYFIWTDAVFSRDKLYFGFRVTNNAGTTINEYGGLWVIDIKTKALYMQNKLSYNTYSGYVNNIGVNKGNALTNSIPSADGYGLFIGWYSGSVGGIDKNISTPYTGGESYIDTDMIPIGKFLDKTNIEHIEFKLSVPLVTGESISLYYRKYITEAFTNVPITQGGGVGEIGGISMATFENLEWLQIRIVSTATVTNPSFNRLKEIRIK